MLWSTWSAPRWPSEAWRQCSTRPSEPCSALRQWRRGGRGAPCSEEETLLKHYTTSPWTTTTTSLRGWEKTSESECALLRLLSLYWCFFKAILVTRPIFNQIFLPLLNRFIDSLWKTFTVHLLCTHRNTSSCHEGWKKVSITRQHPFFLSHACLN